MPAILGHNKNRMYVSADAGVTWTPFTGAAAGGTSSSFGAAVPATGTAIGVNVAGNLRLPTGVNPSGSIYAPQVDIASIGGTTILNGGTAGSQAVGGVVAAGVAVSANPLPTGAKAVTAPPTAVSTGQSVHAQANIYGELIVRHSLREMKSRQATTITASTAETTIVTADATYKLDLYGLILTNTSGTLTKVTITDATGAGTPFVYEVPAGETRGFMLPTCDALRQAAANTNWTATCGTSITSLEITALFVKNL